MNAKALLIDLLQRTIDGKDISDWDDTLRLPKQENTIIQDWAQRIAAVESFYPPESTTELFSKGGLKYLEVILFELKNLDEF